MAGPMDGFTPPFEDPFTTSWWPYILAAVVGIIAFIRTYMGGPDCFSKERIDKKVVVVTGGSTGIGFEIALELSRRGGQVIIGCRDMDSGKAAVDKIKSIVPDTQVDFGYLDLLDFDSIHKFADSVDQVDILINNAAVMGCPFELTEQGYETHLMSNYLGHFLLTHLLLKHLKTSEQGRIVNVSALAHKAANINCEDLNRKDKYVAREAYGQSKLALILMATELSKRLKGTGVTVNTVNPGIVRGSKLFRHSPLGNIYFLRLVIYPWMWLLMKDPRQGAQTPVYAAVAKELDTVSGAYFSDCQVASPSEKATDPTLSKWLYEWSCQATSSTEVVLDDTKENTTED